MLYKEYLYCAKKHLISCRQLLEGLKGNVGNYETYLDIWYLSGYIIEGFVVYSAYKINDWNPSNKDIIEEHDRKFSEKTHLDFYYRRKYKNTSIPVFPKNLITYFIQGHNFNPIIKNILSTNPVFYDLPILGQGKIDPDVKKLVENWNPSIRYWYKDDNSSLKKGLV